MSIISLCGDGYVAAHSNSLSKKRVDAERSLLAGATRQGRHSVKSRSSYSDTASACCARCEHGWFSSPPPRAVGAGYDFRGLLTPFQLICHLSFFFLTHFLYVLCLVLMLSDLRSDELLSSLQIWELTQVSATEAKTLILMLPFCAWPMFLYVCVFNILFSCARVSHMWSWRGVGLSALARSWDFVFLSITHTKSHRPRQ